MKLHGPSINRSISSIKGTLGSFGAVTVISEVHLVGLAPQKGRASGRAKRSRSGNLVDPASSHMLVSKIKPCMSKSNPSTGKSANGSLNRL